MMLMLALAVVAGTSTPCRPPLQHRDDLAWLRANCTVLTRADEHVEQAEALLGRLGTLKDLPRFSLLVIDGLPGPRAFVTRKREIVLSKAALDLCHAKSTPDEAAANVAFMLAHELGHWAHDDPVLLLLGKTDIDVLEFAVPGREDREIKADATAVVDITRAGFDPRVVLRGELLRRWAADGPPKWYVQRKKSLGAQAERVRTMLPSFDAGAALLLAGRYEDAAAVLDAFARETSYDGREVRSDIGFAKLQLARKALAYCDVDAARRFVLPGIVDTHTSAGGFRGTGASSNCRDDGTFRELVEEATTNLRRTVEADRDYAPARLNLVAVLLLAAKYPDALSVTEPKELSGLGVSDQDRLTLASARAVAEYLLGEQLNSADVQRKALADLRRLSGEAPRDVAVAYNLARMLSEQGDPADRANVVAADAWKHVLELGPPGPLAVEAKRMLQPRESRDAVEAEGSPRDDGARTGDPGAPCLTVGPAALPVPLGLVDRKKSPKMFRRTTATLDVGLGELTVYRDTDAGTGRAPVPPRWTAYAIETESDPEAVQLVVQDLMPPLAVSTVREQLGVPDAEIALADGRRVLRYKACAWVVKSEQAVQRLAFQPE